jgi:hypothetical protein
MMRKYSLISFRLEISHTSGIDYAIDWNYFFGQIIVIVIDYGKLFKKRLEDKTIRMKKIYKYQK